MKVAEIIVVEEKDDTRRIQGIVIVDMIETIGSTIDDEILTQIEHAQGTRGMIVFTGPDYLGEEIRKTIMEAVPDAKHAFLSRKVIVPKRDGDGLRAEHASDGTIAEALKKVVAPVQADEGYQEILRQTLVEYGLVAGANVKKHCELLGDDLRIGCTDNKQLVKRLGMFRIIGAGLKKSMTRILRRPASEE